MITIKSERQLGLMRVSSKIVSECFEYIANFIKPGVTTHKINEKVEEFVFSKEAYPAFKGLYGFPAGACISIDEEVVHGIPWKKRVLQEGEIVSIDIGVRYRGFYGDAAYTFPVGEISREKRALLKATWEALYKGIEMAKSGNRLQDISATIQEFAESRGYSVVRELVGHGIGKKLHEDPQVPNYGKKGRGPVLKSGFTLAIEPMINMGTKNVHTLSDGWTIVTDDKKPSAHYEHTVLILDGDPEILTMHGMSP